MLYESIYDLVRQIPYGKVATYGDIARLSGNPRRSRVVGHAMSVCADGTVPCHRVVNRNGELCDDFTPLGKDTHRLLLSLEGVGFLADGRVDLARFRWRPEQ